MTAWRSDALRVKGVDAVCVRVYLVDMATNHTGDETMTTTRPPTMTTPDHLTRATVGNIIAAATFAAMQSDDLLRPSFLRQVEAGAHPLTGHCYTVSEVLRDILGAEYTPHTVRHNGAVHWYLVGTSDGILDATSAQFDVAPDYTAGRGRGFLTSRLSKRATALRARVMLRLSYLDSLDLLG